jgi:chromosome segregation ATPase
VAQLAEARAKLLERKRDAAAESGGDVLASLNKELLTLSVDLRELEARLKFVEAHLPGLRDAMDQLDAWERAEAQLQQARTEQAKASDELHTLSRQGRRHPPADVRSAAKHRPRIEAQRSQPLRRAGRQQ